MPTGFHPNTHFFSAHLELAVELLRFLAVPQFPLVPFTRVRIDKRNLLEARVRVTTYNDHVRLLSPEPWLASATKVYSGMGADIVMESLQCAGINRLEVEDERALRERSSDPSRPRVLRCYREGHSEA